ncbi:MAG TPA: hypothetical protein VIV11_27380 [Kofleriaceae bacterium]
MRQLLCVCLVAGCWVDKRPPLASPQPLAAQPVRVAEPKRNSQLYALDEALADVLSGPLEHIGTGPWFGLFRINVCAYRNERVIVVNMYCTTREMKAFSIVVFSRERGRVVIYAEADQPISGLSRADYFTFKAESEPPPPREKLPPLSLAWQQAELAAWDEKRYHAYIPACYGGVELRKPQGGCLQPLDKHATAWKQRNQAFLDEPPDDWYRIIREMRARAPQHSKPVRP